MRKLRIWLWAALVAAHSGVAQVPLSIDLGFRADLPAMNVYSALPLPDGKVIISGNLQFSDLPNQRPGARLLPNGQRDPTFNQGFLPMGAKLTGFGDKYYCGNGAAVRRFHLNGTIDNTFNMVGAWPQFMAGQAGDYHVFPDGRVLMGGYHSLNIPNQGILGDYNLIWFTSAGQVDTTRVHRTGNSATRRMIRYAEGASGDLAGRFLVYHWGSQYEGQPVGPVFRVFDDGALDPSFTSAIAWGYVLSIEHLQDGRSYLGGLFRLQNEADTVELVRVLPNGELDPSFNNHLLFEKASGVFDIGPSVSSTYAIGDGLVAVVGNFNRVDGNSRGGICILDTLGNVVDHYLQGAGCGPYDYYEFGNNIHTYASIDGIARAPNGQYYIWGAYHGYSDGTTTDSLQRMVTRLHGGEIGLGVPQARMQEQAMRVYPNPAGVSVTVELDAMPRHAELVLRDALGREVLRQRVVAHSTYLDLTQLSEGVFHLELIRHEEHIITQRLVVQP